MTLKITYYSEREIHKSVHLNVSNWYYTNNDLVIISGNDKLILEKVILLNVEAWVSKD